MKFKKVFFLVGCFTTLLGCFLVNTQNNKYHTVIIENTPASNLISNDKGALFSNTFFLQLKNLSFEYYPSRKIKQVKASLLCTHNGENKTIDVSVNHPARFLRYGIYLQDYWPSQGNSPAGVRLMLVRQSFQWLVYIGLVMILISSFVWIVRILYQRGRPFYYVWFVVGLVIAVILFLNPMMRSLQVPPILRSVWFLPHIIAYILSYACLILSFLLAIITFFQHHSKIPQTLFSAGLFLKGGTALYTIGLALGMIWANAAWGAFWNWDPKETCALISWLLCLTVVIVAGMANIYQRDFLWIGRLPVSCKNIVFLLHGLVFVGLILSWFGVSLFEMGGLHVY